MDEQIQKKYEEIKERLRKEKEESDQEPRFPYKELAELLRIKEAKMESIKIPLPPKGRISINRNLYG